MVILIIDLKHERHKLFLIKTLTKVTFLTCDKPNIWSKRSKVHQDDQSLVKLIIFNGHCDLQLVKLAILI